VRIAWITVGSALIGTTAVLASMGSTAAPAPAPMKPEISVVLPEVHALPVASEAGGCPPCQGAPLDAQAWQVQLTTLDGAVALERAAALSVTLPDARSLTAALDGDDPVLRSLAALLLNVGSRRVPSCQAVGRTSVLHVLDRLDRLARVSREGGGAPAEALAVASAQADLVSRGLVPGCPP
jgi:hypothetical protein